MVGDCFYRNESTRESSFLLDWVAVILILRLMPNYDYVCETCGHGFEVFQRMSDDKLTDCPLDECDGKVRRLLGTGAGLIFKGAGFYETDYRSSSYKDAAKKDVASPKSDAAPANPAKKESAKPAKE